MLRGEDDYAPPQAEKNTNNVIELYMVLYTVYIVINIRGAARQGRLRPAAGGDGNLMLCSFL